MEPPLDSSFYSMLLCLVISLGFLALFAFLETSITALRLFKLKELAKTTSRYKKLFETLEQNPHRILITILVASNLANVTTAALSSQLMERLTAYFKLPEAFGFTIGIALTTVTILIAELIPKNIAKAHGEKLFSSTLWITNILYYTLYFFVLLVSRVSQTVVQWVGEGEEHESSEALASEKEIQFLIDYINDKGLMEHHKSAMLKSIFELGTTPIREIMVPEPSIISISTITTFEEAQETFSKYQFSRLPVYEGDTENVIGILHQKDFFLLLSKGEVKDIRAILRPIMFLPESAKALYVLKEFKDKRMHMAMVINEFGSIAGLVTLEDVIEEIVGEINDEYEHIKEKVLAIKPDVSLVDASIALEELSALLAIEFDRENALTLAGFLTEQFQHLPKNGEQLEYKNYIFKIQQASAKRIFQVLIFKKGTPIEHTISS
jgi:putative hemolysin